MSKRACDNTVHSFENTDVDFVSSNVVLGDTGFLQRSFHNFTSFGFSPVLPINYLLFLALDFFFAYLGLAIKTIWELESLG